MEAALLFGIAVGFDLLGDWRGIPQVFAGNLFNPDSYIRLVRIEAGLRAGQIGYAIPRGGFVLHWSHLLDSILLAAAAPLVPWLGWHRALFWVGAASGPVGVGLLAIAVAWATAPLAEPSMRWWAGVAVGVAPGIGAYGRLGVIHHHVLLVLVAVMVAGWSFRAAAGWRGAAVPAGAWFAFGLWLTPETWPFGLLSLGAIGVGWIAGNEGTARALTVAGATLGSLVLAVLLVDPPPGRAVAFDHVSVVHLGLAATIAALGAGLAGIDRLRLGAAGRAGAGAALAVALLGVWAALFPRALLGPAGMTASPGAAVMLASVSEMRPASPPAFAIALLLGGAFGVAASAWVARRERSWLALYGALCGLVIFVLGARYMRFAPYGEALGAAMLPVVLSAIGAVKRVGLLALVLFVPRIAPSFAPVQQAGPGCALADVAGRLAPDAGEIVLASADLTPELLYRTGVRTVGGLYLRDVPGFLRLRAAWDADPGRTVPEAVRATGARLLLFCARPAVPVTAGARTHPTLAGALERGRVPPWLRRLWHDPESGLTLYRIGG